MIQKNNNPCPCTQSPFQTCRTSLVFLFGFVICLYMLVRNAKVFHYLIVFGVFSVIRLRVPVGCTTELNHLGHEFLQRLFDKYDEVSCKPDCLW